MTTLTTPRPVLGPRHEASSPKPAITQLGNGVEVRAYHLPGKRLLNLALVTGGGQLVEPEDRYGIADLTLSMMGEAAGGRTPREFAERLELFGGELQGQAAEGAGIITASAPRSQLRGIAELLTDVVARPDFADRELQRQQATRVDNLAYERATPNSAAAMAMDEHYYPEGSRRRLPPMGTEESIAAITLPDVRAFHAAHVHARGSVLIVVGDLTDVDYEAILEETIGAWQTDGATSLVPEPAAACEGPKFVVIDRPGSVQSALVIGALVPVMDDPSYSGARAAAHALGGGFESRLNQKMREERGYTYGCMAAYDPGTNSSRLQIQSAIETTAIRTAIDDLFAVMRNGADLTQTEIDDALGEIIGGAMLRFGNAGAVLTNGIRTVLSGLPLEHRDQLLARLAEVTPDEANAAWRAHLRLDDAVVVVVGDASALGDLSTLGHGELIVIQGEPMEPDEFDEFGDFGEPA